MVALSLCGASSLAYVCCGYVKRGKSYCSSNIVGYGTLLTAVNNDLKEIINCNVSMDKLLDVVKGKIGHKQSAHEKELIKLLKQQDQLEKDL